MTIRAVIALLLMIGFYVVALGIAGFLLYLPYAEVVYAHRLHFKLAAFCLIGAAVIVWAVLPRRDRFEPPWPTLSRRDESKLFRLIEAVARATGQRVPKTVYLTPEVNAWVAQRGGMLGVGGQRVMGLGLPLLAVLTERELFAVLAHEFGHFHGGDTKLGPIIYRTRSAMGRTIEALEEHSSALRWIFLAYGKLFIAVTHAISRHQERLADALAASVAGSTALSRALKKTHGAALAYDSYWSTEAAPVLSKGLLPPLAAGFDRFVRSERIEQAMRTALDRALAENKAHGYDTHPPLHERLRALERMPDKAMPEGGLAITLMPTVAARERELMDAMLKPEAARRLKEASWDEVAARVYLPQYQAIAYEHGGHCAGMSIGDVPTCARDVAAAIGERMAAQSDEAWPEDERLRQGAWAIGAIMAATLAQADWTLATAPGDPVRLVNGDMSLDPFSLAQAIVTGRMDAAEWAERCRSLGISDVTLAPDAPRIEEPNPVAS
jgi:Zn-dependent protease with chaperone function